MCVQGVCLHVFMSTALVIVAALFFHGYQLVPSGVKNRLNERNKLEIRFCERGCIFKNSWLDAVDENGLSP